MNSTMRGANSDNMTIVENKKLNIIILWLRWSSYNKNPQIQEKCFICSVTKHKNEMWPVQQQKLFIMLMNTDMDQLLQTFLCNAKHVSNKNDFYR